MKRQTKRAIAAALSLAVAVTSAGIPSGAADAKAVRPSIAKKVTVNKGRKKTLKIRNASGIKRVKWSVNKKKIVKISGGKKKVVITGKKAGKAVIKANVTYKAGAKTKKITLKTKVTVKESGSSSSVTASNTPAAGVSTAPAVNTPAAGVSAAPTINTPGAEATASPSAGTSEPDTTPEATASPSVNTAEPDINTPSPEITASPSVNTPKPASSSNPVTVVTAPQKFNDLNSDEIIKEMGTGWNLGNTYEGWTTTGKDENGNLIFTPSEKAWQSLTVTKSLIKRVHDLGFNTIRIPVSWGSMINDDYSINEEWMMKVQQVVDYAQELNMYTIINIHHDGMSDHPGENDLQDYTNFLKISTVLDDPDNLDQKLYKEFAGVWKSIAERFKNYDEHLIFEDMNEVYLNTRQTLGDKGAIYGWTSDDDIIKEELNIIGHLNQIFVDTVRSTGSNNAKRWLVVPTVNTQVDKAFDKTSKGETKWSFSMPKDKTLSSPRLMLSIHDYDTAKVSDLKDSISNTKGNTFKKLYDKFVANGYPVIVGEYGPNAMTGGNYNPKDDYKAPAQYEIINYIAKKFKITLIAWDTGSIVNRTNDSGNASNIIDSIMRGYYADSEENVNKIQIKSDKSFMNSQIQDNKKNGYTGFTLDSSELSIPAGSKKEISLASHEPESAADALIWSSSDETVATVSNGLVTANAPGECTVTARSIYNSSVTASVKITVTNAEIQGAPVSEIVATPSAVEITEGSDTVIFASALDKDGNLLTDYKLTFTSSDPAHVSVSRSGQVIALDDGNTEYYTGSAVITIKSTDGNAQVEVPVSVVEPKKEDHDDSDSKLSLALNVYMYNANGQTVTGKPVAVNGDGEYTVKVDTSDITADQTVTDFNDVATVYITDTSSAHNYYKSAEINYSSIKVNGQELKLNADASKKRSPYKGTSFNTGTPLNAWDGVYADNVTIDKYTLSFDNIEKPYTSFEITFTLTGID